MFRMLHRADMLATPGSATLHGLRSPGPRRLEPVCIQAADRMAAEWLEVPT